MSIKTMSTKIRTYARARKDRLGDAATPCIVVVRESQIIAVMSCGDLSALVGLAKTAAAGYGADALGLVLEGVFPLVPSNPLTGQPWGRGEAEEVWSTRDGATKGWVCEAQVIAVASRAGESVEEAWPFTVGTESVVWGEELPLGGTGLVGALAAALSSPIADASRVADPGDGFVGDPENGPFYDPEYGRVVLDIGVTRILGNQILEHQGEACLLVDSPERAEYLVSEGLHPWHVELMTSDEE